jgi:hypothetical protein
MNCAVASSCSRLRSVLSECGAQDTQQLKNPAPDPADLLLGAVALTRMFFAAWRAQDLRGGRDQRGGMAPLSLGYRAPWARQAHPAYLAHKVSVPATPQYHNMALLTECGCGCGACVGTCMCERERDGVVGLRWTSDACPHYGLHPSQRILLWRDRGGSGESISAMGRAKVCGGCATVHNLCQTRWWGH